MPDHAAAASGRGRIAVESLKNALERALRQRGLGSELKGWDAVKEWPRVVGEHIASHTRAIRFQQGTLELEVDGSSWMNELSLLKPRLLKKMNAEGHGVVCDLRYRVASFPRGGNQG